MVGFGIRSHQLGCCETCGRKMCGHFNCIEVNFREMMGDVGMGAKIRLKKSCTNVCVLAHTTTTPCIIHYSLFSRTDCGKYGRQSELACSNCSTYESNAKQVGRYMSKEVDRQTGRQTTRNYNVS